MAGYIGTIPVPQATQTRETFTANANQTSFSTGGYTPNFIDVFMNGVKLAPADFTATNGSDVVLASGAAANDIIDIVAFTAFQVLNQNFTGNTSTQDLTVSGNLTVTGSTITIDTATVQNVDLGDNDKIRLGDGDDLQIYHSGSHSFISDTGTGGLKVLASNIYIRNPSEADMITAASGSSVELYHNGNKKFETTATGVDVTGALKVAGSSVVTASTDADDLVIEKTGDTGLSILSTTTGRIYFGDAANDDAGSIRYVHSDNSMRFETDDAERMRIDSSGKVGIGTSPSALLHASGAAASGGAVEIRLEDTAASSNSRLMRTGSAYSYSGVGANETWLYHAGAGTINIGPDGAGAVKIVNNGSERVRIDSIGHVGIGNSTPSNNHANANNLVVGNGTAGGIANYVGTGLGWYAFSRDNANNSDAFDGGISYDGSRNLMFHTNAGNERMRIDSSGRLSLFNTRAANYTGAGSNSMAVGSNSSASTSHGITIVAGTSATSNLAFTDNAGDGSANDYRGLLQYAHADDSLIIFTASAERMRIDSNGRLLHGKSSTAFHVAGARLDASGNTEITRAGGPPLHLNRTSDDGPNTVFYKDGSTVGAIGVYGGDLYVVNQPLDGAGAGLKYNSGYPNILPCNGAGSNRDNAIDLGGGVVRFDDVYATNGTIQTSDETEKQDIASLTSAEITAATAISKLFKTYKWKDKVAAKGDAARTHSGVIAQEVDQAMSGAGLDASNYAFWCSNTWWETETEVAAVEAVEAQDAVYDEEGNLVSEAVEAVEAKDAYTRTDTYDTQEEAPEGATERNRKGIRYPELLSFIGAATEQRLTSIESRLTALEAG